MIIPTPITQYRPAITRIILGFLLLALNHTIHATSLLSRQENVITLIDFSEFDNKLRNKPENINPYRTRDDERKIFFKDPNPDNTQNFPCIGGSENAPPSRSWSPPTIARENFQDIDKRYLSPSLEDFFLLQSIDTNEATCLPASYKGYAHILKPSGWIFLQQKNINNQTQEKPSFARLILDTYKDEETCKKNASISKKINKYLDDIEKILNNSTNEDLPIHELRLLIDHERTPIPALQSILDRITDMRSKREQLEVAAPKPSKTLKELLTIEDHLIARKSQPEKAIEIRISVPAINKPYKIQFRPRHLFFAYDRSGRLHHLKNGLVENVKDVLEWSLTIRAAHNTSRMRNRPVLPVSLVIRNEKGHVRHIPLGTYAKDEFCWDKLRWLNKNVHERIPSEKKDIIDWREIPYWIFEALEFEFGPSASPTTWIIQLGTITTKIREAFPIEKIRGASYAALRAFEDKTWTQSLSPTLNRFNKLASELSTTMSNYKEIKTYIDTIKNDGLRSNGNPVAIEEAIDIISNISREYRIKNLKPTIPKIKSPFPKERQKPAIGPLRYHGLNRYNNDLKDFQNKYYTWIKYINETGYPYKKQIK